MPKKNFDTINSKKDSSKEYSLKSRKIGKLIPVEKNNKYKKSVSKEKKQDILIDQVKENTETKERVFDLGEVEKESENQNKEKKSKLSSIEKDNKDDKLSLSKKNDDFVTNFDRNDFDLSNNKDTEVIKKKENISDNEFNDFKKETKEVKDEKKIIKKNNLKKEEKNKLKEKKLSFFDTIFSKKDKIKEEKSKENKNNLKEEKKDDFFGKIDEDSYKIDEENLSKSKEEDEFNKEKKDTNIKQDKQKEDKKNEDKEKLKLKKPVKKQGFIAFLTKSRGNAESEFIIQNLALFLSSGIGILSALMAIKSETKNKAFIDTIENIRLEIEDGSPLWKALKKYEVVNEHTIALIKIGEGSGKLTENLNVIATQQQKDKTFRQKIISAMMYPAIVLGMVVVVGLGIAWFILPRLATVFSSMNMELPVLTRAVIALGNFLNIYGYIAVPGIIFLIALLVYIFFYASKTKYLGQALLFKLPGFKPLIQNMEITRMGFILGMLLDAGVPIYESLNSLYESTTTIYYKNIFKFLKDNINEGKSFQKSFNEYKDINKFIPVPVQQMLISAEQSGSLSQVLIKIGQIYEEKTDYVTRNLTVMVEPILLFIVWGGVLIVALSVIVPIYSLVGGFGQASRNVSNIETSSNLAESELEKDSQKAQEQEKINESNDAKTYADLEKEKSSPAPTPSPTPEIKKQIEILNTETGTLNVRTEPNTSSEIITQVKPGEIYEFSEKSNDWYKIFLTDGKSGWVSAQYVKEI